jgi:hypothetical protein
VSPRRGDGGPWVGDEVRDAGTGRSAVVTDVRGGSYVLRPVYGGGPHWLVADPARLTVPMTSARRAAEGRI